MRRGAGPVLGPRSLGGGSAAAYCITARAEARATELVGVDMDRVNRRAWRSDTKCLHSQDRCPTQTGNA